MRENVSVDAAGVVAKLGQFPVMPGANQVSKMGTSSDWGPELVATGQCCYFHGWLVGLLVGLFDCLVICLFVSWLVDWLVALLVVSWLVAWLVR